MPLLTCPDCSRQVSDQAVACPHCGRPNRSPARGEAERARRRKEASPYNTASWLLFVLAVLLGLAGAGVAGVVVFLVALLVSVIYLVKR